MAYIKLRGLNYYLVTSNQLLAHYAKMTDELIVLDFIDSLNPSKDVFYDIGSAEGRFAIYAGVKGLPTVAFEPEKLNFEALQKNIKANHLINAVAAKKLALSNKIGNEKLIIGQPIAGGHLKILEKN